MKKSTLALFVSLSALGLSISATAALAVSVGQSFTPTSVLVPIASIGLVGSDGNHAIYNCAADTMSGCALDLANQAALTAAFASGATASVAAGTYTQVYINTCPGNSGGNVTSYTLKVKGSVTLGGALVTSAGTGAGTDLLVTAGTADYASFTVSGCQTNFPIAGAGLTVTKGSSLTVNLLVDIQNLVHALNGPISNHMGGACLGGTSTSLCYSYPVMIPYVGSAAPTKETYRLTTAADSSGNMGYGELTFFLDSSDAVIGISSRNYFGPSTYLGTDSTTPVAQPSGAVCSSATCTWKITPFISSFRTFDKNADGSYNLVGWGDSGAVTPSQILIPTFSRTAVGGTSTGTMTSDRGLFSSTMSDTSIKAAYKAVRIN